MRWSGDAGANPFAGKLNTFWGITASSLPVKVDYVGQLAAARESRQKMAHAARLTLFARPALTQGYQQVVVDMPLDSSMPTIKEVGGAVELCDHDRQMIWDLVCYRWLMCMWFISLADERAGATC